MEIEANYGTDVRVSAHVEVYGDEAVVKMPDGESVEDMIGDLTDPDFLRKLADFIEACKTSDEVGAIHIDID